MYFSVFLTIILYFSVFYFFPIKSVFYLLQYSNLCFYAWGRDADGEDVSLETSLSWFQEESFRRGKESERERNFFLLFNCDGLKWRLSERWKVILFLLHPHPFHIFILSLFSSFLLLLIDVLLSYVLSFWNFILFLSFSSFFSFPLFFLLPCYSLQFFFFERKKRTPLGFNDTIWSRIK